MTLYESFSIGHQTARQLAIAEPLTTDVHDVTKVTDLRWHDLLRAARKHWVRSHQPLPVLVTPEQMRALSDAWPVDVDPITVPPPIDHEGLTLFGMRIEIARDAARSMR